MKIISYNLELDEERKPMLVKEFMCDYVVMHPDPDSIYKMMSEVFHADRLAEERAWLISMNTKLKPKGIFEVSHGKINQSLIGIQEIFTRLLLSGGNHFVIVHNHPSGNPIPSNADYEITNRLIEAGKVMDIKLEDHIVIGDNSHPYFSMREHEPSIFS